MEETETLLTFYLGS
jgi:hypothetical protein